MPFPRLWPMGELHAFERVPRKHKTQMLRQHLLISAWWDHKRANLGKCSKTEKYINGGNTEPCSAWYGERSDCLQHTSVSIDVDDFYWRRILKIVFNLHCYVRRVQRTEFCKSNFTVILPEEHSNGTKKDWNSSQQYTKNQRCGNGQRRSWKIWCVYLLTNRLLLK